MKLFLKKYIVLIISLGILFGLGAWTSYDYHKFWDGFVKEKENIIKRCDTIHKDNPEMKDFCEEMRHEKDPVKIDTISLYFNYVMNGKISVLQLIAPLFIAIPAIYFFHRKLKSGYIKNELTRMGYKKYMKKTIIGSYKYCLIMPIFILFMFFLAYLQSGHFDIKQTFREYEGGPYIDKQYIMMLPQFLTVYVTTIILHSIFWIHLGFIITKKSKNFLITIVSFFLSYIAIFIVCEIFIGGFLLSSFFHLKNVMSYVTLSSIWIYDGIHYLWIMPLFGLVLVLLSGIVVYFMYRHKEDVILENEC